MTSIKSRCLAGLSAAVMFCFLMASSVCALEEKVAQPASTYSDDEKALRAQAAQYGKAFSAGDAKAIAATWDKDGIFIDSAGRECHGRDEIEKLYARYFSRTRRQPLEVVVESISFPASNVAIEEGVTRLSTAPSAAQASKYTAVHVKRDDRWQMYRVTETGYRPTSNSEYLKDLSWLIGNWTAEGPKGKVHFRADRIGKGDFIYCTYMPDKSDGAKVSEVQVIGWNPLIRQISSWSFDSAGGLGRAIWLRNGQNWMLRAIAAQPDGQRATARYVLHKIDNDSFTWRSTRRTLGRDRLPDTVEVKVMRDTGK